MKRKFVFAHMRATRLYGDMSTCKRRKVGAMIVMGNTPIAIGYNGTAPGEDNCCETADNQTKPDVIHAEDNAYRKLEANGIFPTPEDIRGSALFVTACPCPVCLPMALKRGTRTFFFSDDYRVMEHVTPYLTEKELPVIIGNLLFYRVNTESETITKFHSDLSGNPYEVEYPWDDILIL